jgi:hypothetical protein
VCIGLQQLRRWVAAAPNEIHAESAVRDTSCVTTPRASKSKPSKKRATASPWPAGQWLAIAACALGLVAASVGLLSDSRMLLVSRQAWWCATTHLLASTTLLGMMILCGLQLSCLSAPDLLGPRHVHPVDWLLLSRITLVMAVAEAALCATIFLRTPPDFREALEAAALEKLFGITLLIVSFTAWMIPYRLATFQTKGDVKGWTALALTAWIMILVLVLIAALPITWPWESTVT